MRTFEFDDKDALVQLRLPLKLKTQAEAKARRQGMTLSRYIRTVIERDVKRTRAASHKFPVELTEAIETVESAMEELSSLVSGRRGRRR